MAKKIPLVAIVGRPNVGKSSLVNRLISKRDAIVHNTPGVTRDRKYFECSWNGVSFKLIDTGGIYTKSTRTKDLSFQKEIEIQVDIAIAEADLILLAVDVKEGLHPIDKEITRKLLKNNIPIFLVINKVDTIEKIDDSLEFHALGIEKQFPVSAQHNLNIAELMDEITAALPAAPQTPEKEDEELPIKIAIVGRPNAGKSSLLNTLLGKERALVSPIAGTTRDSINETLKYNNVIFTFVDTAGIRKKAKVTDDVEYYSVKRAIEAIEACDIAILLIDATRMVEEQDQKIAGLIQERKKACLIVINKWDLVEKDSTTILRYTEQVRKNLKFLAYSPLLFISAVEKIRTYNIYDELLNIYENYSLRIETGPLNRALQKIVAATPPKAFHNKVLKIYYASQVSTRPPEILVFVNNNKHLHFSYQRYLLNQLREVFGFSGSPLMLYFRNKPEGKDRARAPKEQNKF